MRLLITAGALALVLALGGCGDDDGGGDVIDASAGGDGGGGGDGDGGGDEADAGGNGGGTQGPGQFCETLEDGPYCMEGLECCDDHVCRYDGDCPGDTQYIPCDCTDECPTGLCCDVGGQMESFCTKRSACNDYEGEEDTMCP